MHEIQLMTPIFFPVSIPFPTSLPHLFGRLGLAPAPPSHPRDAASSPAPQTRPLLCLLEIVAASHHHDDVVTLVQCILATSMTWICPYVERSWIEPMPPPLAHAQPRPLRSVTYLSPAMIRLIPCCLTEGQPGQHKPARICGRRPSNSIRS
jgi:hypothetical protein